MKQRITYLLPEGHRADAEDIEIDSDSLKYTKAGQAAEEWRITLGWDELPSSYSRVRRILDATFVQRLLGDKATDDEAARLRVQELDHADYTDVDFDAISSTITLTAVWSPVASAENFNSTRRASGKIRGSGANQRIEVGVLHPEKAKEPEELSLGGFLTVIGDNDHPSRTLFAFPARHHPLPPADTTTFKASFQQPTGLHPELQITLPQEHLTPPKDTCRLHAYWTLPSALFLDRYQFSDSLFLASKHLVKLHSLSGEQDLEAPDWVIDRWGSAALLELATPPARPTVNENVSSQWTATVPTHLRYLTARPNSTANADFHYLTSDANSVNDSSHATLDVPWPIVFWACEAEEGLKMATNPFDRVNLGYDGLFGPKTMFYHIPPAVNSIVETIRVPVLDIGKWVPIGTLMTVALGFAWVCWRLFRAVSVTGGSTTRVKEKNKKQ
ncbi:protease B nonderepressible form [Extremus antarcticus]|uniref:Protein PBN1 n=1 Tax=Extremus antarcticus TaxID=702011 RepID=A0AAJ0G8Y5_9PEZI|nr:protease B nonderepressible form [Extremus antarcticus]